METTISEKLSAKYWIGVIAFAILLAILGNIWLALQPSYYMVVNYNLGYVGCALSLSPMSFLAIFLVLLAGRFLKSYRSMEALTMIYAIAMMSTFFCTSYFPWYIPGSVFGSRFVEPELSIKYFPWYMAPSKDVAQKMIFSSGLDIPITEWLPALLFWSLFQIIFSLFAMSLAIILRRGWLDVEKLPFPHTQIMYTFMSKATREGSEGFMGKLGKPLLIGMLVGLVVQIPIFMTFIFPWFPDIYSWKVNNCYFGATWITSDSPLAPIAGLQTFNKWPPFIGLFYLVPIFVLRSFLLSFLIFIILTQIFYTMGYYTGVLDKAGCGRNWCPPDPGQSPPIKWYAMSNIGGPIGLALWYMVMNRHYLFDTLRTAFGNRAGKAEQEEKEALSYRGAWALLFGSAIAIIALSSIVSSPESGTGWIAALIVPLVAIVWIFGARVYAYTGFNGVVYSGAGTAFVWSLWPQQPMPITNEWFMNIFMERTLLTDGSYGYGWSGAFPAIFSSFKMADLTGTSNKKILKVIVVVLLVVPFFSLLSMVVVSHLFGASKFAEYSDMGSNVVMRFAFAGSHESWPASAPYFYEVALGIILVGVLGLLHSRFLWFPIEPIGWLMSISEHTQLEGVWTSILIAYVAKTITLRVGGSKAYEDYGVPVASGLMIGTAIAILLGGFIGAVRFFMPF
jgi:hypothetical protein